MEIYQQIQNQAETILGELQADGLSLSVTDTLQLHIVGKAKPSQLALIRLWKQNIIDVLSQKCTNCALPMQIVDDGELWFCPFGCSSQKRQGKTRLGKNTPVPRRTGAGDQVSLDYHCKVTSLTSLTSQPLYNKAEKYDVTSDVTQNGEKSNVTNVTEDTPAAAIFENGDGRNGNHHTTVTQLNTNDINVLMATGDGRDGCDGRLHLHSDDEEEDEVPDKVSAFIN